MLGDVLRYTVSPLLGWLQMPLLKWAMFSPARVPARFQAEYSPAMALRPSQIRATSVDGALMIPGALALRGDYKDLTLPVVIIAGDGDKVVFKRRSEQLRDSIPGSVLQIVKGAGHMVHHLAPRQVAQAVENVAGAPCPPLIRSQPLRLGCSSLQFGFGAGLHPHLPKQPVAALDLMGRLSLRFCVQEARGRRCCVPGLFPGFASSIASITASALASAPSQLINRNEPDTHHQCNEPPGSSFSGSAESLAAAGTDGCLHPENGAAHDSRRRGGHKTAGREAGTIRSSGRTSPRCHLQAPTRPLLRQLG